MSLKPTAKTFTLFTLSITFAGLLSSCVGPGASCASRRGSCRYCQSQKIGGLRVRSHASRAPPKHTWILQKPSWLRVILSELKNTSILPSKPKTLRLKIRWMCTQENPDQENLDSDGDGITDQDACPDNPEDKDNYEDSDGCPDPDNDQDTVLDPMDECPNQKGPVDNNGCPFGDKDGDGINDKDDKCPLQAEDFDEDRDQDGCPDVDTDKDGLEDDVDQCPTQPEDIDGFVDEDGCPDIDNDQDGIIDTVDQCPVEAGLPQASGCPDMDGDFIADKDDKCPEEYGVRQPDKPEKNGCPKGIQTHCHQKRPH